MHFLVLSYLSLLNACRISDSTGQCRCRCDCRTGKVYLAAHMSHASDEVSVRGCDSPLSICEYSHVTSETRTTGRSTYHGPCENEGLEESLFHCLQIDLLSSREYDGSHLRMYLFSSKYACSDTKITDSAIRTRTDHYLIDLHLSHLVYGTGIIRKMRK